jgi:hypothetical protein
VVSLEFSYHLFGAIIDPGVFSMSSGARDLGENLESCSESLALRESGASRTNEVTGAEGCEILRVATSGIDSDTSSEEHQVLNLADHSLILRVAISRMDPGLNENVIL